MKHPISAVLAMLPATSRSRLEGFVKAAAEKLGPELHSVVVYGSAVRGGLTVYSDVDVLLVLQPTTPTAEQARLRQLHDLVTVARAAARLDVRVLSVDELARSADVFPVFFDDVKDAYSVAVGGDAFAGLVVHGEHRRLQIEQQLREHQLQLREAIIAFALDDEQLRLTVLRHLKVLRAAFAALIRLHAGDGREVRRPPASDLTTVLDVLGARYRLDTQPLTTSSGPIAALVQAWQSLLAAAVDDVDTLRQPPPPSTASTASTASTTSGSGVLGALPTVETSAVPPATAPAEVSGAPASSENLASSAEAASADDEDVSA